MKNSCYLLLLLYFLLSCAAGDKDKVKIDGNWEIIERAWQVNSSMAEDRDLAVEIMNKKSLSKLSVYFPQVIRNLKRELRSLSEEELIGFNHFVEKKLFEIDRKEIHRYTDGGDDGFYYVRGFILGLGHQYYDKVNNLSSGYPSAYNFMQKLSNNKGLRCAEEPARADLNIVLWKKIKEFHHFHRWFLSIWPAKSS